MFVLRSTLDKMRGRYSEAYNTLWKTVDIMIRDLNSERNKVKKLREAIADLGEHAHNCDCHCMDHRGIARQALKETK